MKARLVLYGSARRSFLFYLSMFESEKSEQRSIIDDHGKKVQTRPKIIKNEIKLEIGRPVDSSCDI